MTTLIFDYLKAFDRNLGWLSSEEQTKLRTSCVAIAGLGGTGGYQAEVLARLGVGRFKIGDPDTYEPTNLNRQLGATVETFGASKTEVIRKRILSINPEASVETFPEGLTQGNADRFLESVDFAVDGIDFFAVDSKLTLFEACFERKISVLTSCPLGFGASLIIFSPNGMKYTDYFDLHAGMSEKEKRTALTFGLSPSPLCLRYRRGKTVDIDTQRASSVAPGLMLTAALTGTEAVKVLTGKGKAAYCPHIYQIDLMTRKVRRKYYPFGMRSPWQKLRRWVFSKMLQL